MTKRTFFAAIFACIITCGAGGVTFCTGSEFRIRKSVVRTLFSRNALVVVEEIVDVACRAIRRLIKAFRALLIALFAIVAFERFEERSVAILFKKLKRLVKPFKYICTQ